jgi:hypothetical protein
MFIENKVFLLKLNEHTKCSPSLKLFLEWHLLSISLSLSILYRSLFQSFCLKFNLSLPLHSNLFSLSLSLSLSFLSFYLSLSLFLSTYLCLSISISLSISVSISLSVSLSFSPPSLYIPFSVLSFLLFSSSSFSALTMCLHIQSVCWACMKLNES